MFDSLSSKLQNAFRNLRGLGKISESNVGDALREVRLALLEADVNFKVARDFIDRVKTKSIGEEVVQSIQPGQQIVKIIHDELVGLLGSQNAGLDLTGNPSGILNQVEHRARQPKTEDYNQSSQTHQRIFFPPAYRRRRQSRVSSQN